MMRSGIRRERHFTFLWVSILAVFTAGLLSGQTGTLWSPVMEWTVDDVSYSGNPYDVLARVRFTHTETGDTVSSLMFYDTTSVWEGWKFRFTGMCIGIWNYLSNSDNEDLDGLSGSVSILENPDPEAHGFMKNFGNRWGWQGTEKAFIPQIVMFSTPLEFYNDPDYIEAKIDTFIEDHGFNGFHVRVYCQWFELGNPVWDGQPDNVNPDIRTFRALEDLIQRVHAAGGMVHLWMWGDTQSKSSIDYSLWGKNGIEDKRLQRYIAARLGPLPGWSMGYGFDLDEWVTEAQIDTWISNMHVYLGKWPHFLGGRPAGPNSGMDHSPYIGWNTGLDYSSYEHHKPTYAVYHAAMNTIPDQPVFSEDRFRIRESAYPEKDYNELSTIRGMVHSAMAGGAANIWGNFMNSSWEPVSPPGFASWVYDSASYIKTCSRIFAERFTHDMIPDSTLSDGYCLKRPDSRDYIFFKRDAESLYMDLSCMNGPRFAFAVNCLASYDEIGLGWLDPVEQTAALPFRSDWFIVIGYGCSLKARIFLEGTYDRDSGEMRTGLNDASNIPLESPYPEDKRIAESIPPDVTDWILVELRDSETGNTVIFKSSFLHRNGIIVWDDGITDKIWLETDPGDYYVVVRHRNHLQIMSSEKVALD